MFLVTLNSFDARWRADLEAFHVLALYLRLTADGGILR